MMHLAHLVRADVRRFRLLLAAWLLIQIMSAAFTLARPALLASQPLAAAGEVLGTVLFVARWLGLLVIVPLVVQAHPLVGSEAFWLTRPISRSGLLASKLLLLAATFVALPIMCGIVEMLASGVTAGDIFRVSLQTGCLETLLLLVVMLLAALTGSFAQFAMVAGGLVVTFAVIVNAALVVLFWKLGAEPTMHEVTGRSIPDPAASIAMFLFFTGAALAPVVVQYRTRSRKATLAAVALGVVIAVIAIGSWPYQVTRLAVPGWAASGSRPSLTADSSRGEFRPFDVGSPWSESVGWQVGTAAVRLTGLEPGWLATAQLATSTLTFGNGRTLSTAGNGYTSSLRSQSGNESPARAAVQHVLGVQRVWEGPPDTDLRDVDGIMLSDAEFRAHIGDRASYRGTFVVSLDRLAIAASLPLRVGSAFRDPHLLLTIEHVALHARTAAVRLRRVTSRTMFDATTLPQLSFYLRNRQRGEAVSGASQDAVSSSLGIPLVGSNIAWTTEQPTGFHLDGIVVHFPDGYWRESPEVGLTSDWLRDAELLIVQTVPAGSVTRTVVIPELEIASATARSSP
jgi:hypothetical protein